MDTRYTVMEGGLGWTVRNPRGKSVAAYPPGRWPEAVAHAHRLAALDQIRDAKHAELFPYASPFDSVRQALVRLGNALARTPTRDDYVLAN